MAKLNLNALSQAANTKEVEETISTTVEAIGETLQETPSKKPRISLKNGKISTISHQEIVQAVEEKSVSIQEEVSTQKAQMTKIPEVKQEEVKKSPARISLKKEKVETITKEKIPEVQAVAEEPKEQNIEQKTELPIEPTEIVAEKALETSVEIIEEKKEEVKNFVIQDADTQVEVIHHQKKELFTNYAGSYTKEEPKKEEVKVPESISQEVITPVSETIPEISQEKNIEITSQTQNEQTQNTRITNEATPLQNIQKTQKYKKSLLATLGTLSLCVIGGFAFMNLSGDKITGNIQEIPPVAQEQVIPPPPVEVEITSITPETPMGTPEELTAINEVPNTQQTPPETPTEINNIPGEIQNTLTQNTQTGNVNTNTSSDVDNQEKNDKIKDEVKKYLLKKYKTN